MSKGLEAWLSLGKWFVDYINKQEHKEIDSNYFTSDKCGTTINGIPTVIITKELKAFEIIKKYIYYSKQSHCIRTRELRKSTHNFDYEDLKEMLVND